VKQSATDIILYTSLSVYCRAEMLALPRSLAAAALTARRFTRSYSALKNWATIDVQKWDGANPHKVQNLGAF
jgi:hypothetical protein